VGDSLRPQQSRRQLLFASHSCLSLTDSFWLVITTVNVSSDCTLFRHSSLAPASRLVSPRRRGRPLERPRAVQRTAAVSKGLLHWSAPAFPPLGRNLGGRLHQQIHCPACAFLDGSSSPMVPQLQFIRCPYPTLPCSTLSPACAACVHFLDHDPRLEQTLTQCKTPNR
jgi:hypothetical protein